jgi:distribution and morphology protein 12
MSFDISWDKLDKQLAQKVQDIINEHFRTTNNKPLFIGDIEISDFDFGTIPPSVEIVDVTDPFPEFYLPDNVVVEVDVRSDLAESRIVGGVRSRVRNGNGNGGMRAGVEEGRTRESVVNNGQQMSHHASSSFPQSNPLHNNNNNNKPPITPIITSTITSSPTAITPSSLSTISDTSAEYLYQRQQRFRNSEISLNLKDYNHQIDEQLQFESSNSEEEVPLNQDTDSQINVEMSYKGNMKMVISTELYMNYPSLMFMSLPVRLTITGFEFSGEDGFNCLIVYFFSKKKIVINIDFRSFYSWN